MSVDVYLTGFVDLSDTHHSNKSPVNPDGVSMTNGVPLVAPLTYSLEINIKDEGGYDGRVHAACGEHDNPLGIIAPQTPPGSGALASSLSLLRLLAGWVYINGRRVHIGSGDIGAAVDEALRVGDAPVEQRSRSRGGVSAAPSGVDLFMVQLNPDAYRIYGMPNPNGAGGNFSVTIKGKSPVSESVGDGKYVDATRAKASEPWQLGSFKTPDTDDLVLARLRKQVSVIAY